MDRDGAIYLLFSLMVPIMVFVLLGDFGGGIYSLIAIALTLLTVLLIVGMNWADFVIFPAFTSLLGVSFQPSAGYKIPKQQNAIVKEVNGLYYATGYLTANMYSYTFKIESAEQDDEYKMISAPENWERIVSNIGFPMKFHVLASGLDVQKVRDDLEGRRSYQEFQLARAMQGSNPEVAVTDIQRKINTIQAKIDRISQGERPIAALMYLETSAIGISEKEALDSLGYQVDQIKVAFSSMDLSINRIAGRELYYLFKYNFALPSHYGEMAQSFDTQG
ncbi:MAG: hypothetical protein M1500_00270 [Candidatus Marsarchaeota archaeon]|nr:hypothetical protein [Candidatus Marsarchaeota archaeon]MCL5112141.1 hypothetical protein [Candidatus Marsarchaeota archaeon]